MFRYLILFGVSFYLVLLIGGQDRGQQRMGLAGAYTVVVPPLAPPVDPAPAPQAAPRHAALPADTLRILPAQPQPATPVDRPDSTAAPLRTITAEAANVRDGADRSASVIGRVERGEVVQMVGQTGDWVQIRIEGDGIEGFVHRRLISTEPPNPEPATRTAVTLFQIAD